MMFIDQNNLNENMLDKNKMQLTCRSPLSIDNGLKPASRIISNHVDRYPVRCLECQLDGIPRGSFADHVSKVCVKTNISCLASDILCPWTRPRDQLDDRLDLCVYQRMRPALESVQANHARLEQLLIDQQ